MFFLRVRIFWIETKAFTQCEAGGLHTLVTPQQNDWFSLQLFLFHLPALERSIVIKDTTVLTIMCNGENVIFLAQNGLSLANTH